MTSAEIIREIREKLLKIRDNDKNFKKELKSTIYMLRESLIAIKDKINIPLFVIDREGIIVYHNWKFGEFIGGGNIESEKVEISPLIREINIQSKIFEGVEFIIKSKKYKLPLHVFKHSLYGKTYLIILIY